MHAQRGDCMKRHQEGGHLQAKERGLRRNQLFGYLALDFKPPALWENGFLLFKPLKICGILLWLSQEAHTKSVLEGLDFSEDVYQPWIPLHSPIVECHLLDNSSYMNEALWTLGFCCPVPLDLTELRTIHHCFIGCRISMFTWTGQWMCMIKADR